MILFVNHGGDDLFCGCSDLKQTSQNDYVNANLFIYFFPQIVVDHVIVLYRVMFQAVEAASFPDWPPMLEFGG